MTGQVTALGIRDGDPAVLHALVERRGFAVLAYCERACAPGLADEAAADAFARFRARVLTTPRPAGIDPEAALLSATRHAAADRAPRPTGPTGGALGRLLGGKVPTELVEAVPHLLATRADGVLDPSDEERLNRLLDASASARAVEERFHGAEHAYRTAVPRPVSPAIADLIVRTMSAESFNGSSPYDTDPQMTEEWVAVDLPDAPEPQPTVAFEVQEYEIEDLEPEPLPEPVAEQPEPEPEAEPVAEQPEPEPEAEPVADEPAPEEPEPEPEPEPAAEELELTEEWSVPTEDPGHEHALDVEIAASRVSADEDAEAPEEDADEEAAHLQSASGAVDEPLVEEGEVEAEPPVGPEADEDADDHDGPVAEEANGSRALPRPPSRHAHGLPGRGALAPAAAVVTIAAIGALVASGVFGGNDPSPSLDTGIVPPRALQAVPEGETAQVVDDLRSAAADARRQRLADRRQALAAAQLDAEAPGSGTAPGAAGP